MTDTALRRSLAAAAALAATAFAAVLLLQDGEQRDRLWVEVGRGLIQLVVIGVAGTALKLIADGYQARGERAERHYEFRIDKHRRLLAATNVLRRAAILVAANRSVRTWTGQMDALMDAGFELRAIKHEIGASAVAADPPPFLNGDAIMRQVDAMAAYIDWVVADFADNKKRLGERQRWAEASGIDDDQRTQRQAAIWEELSGLPSVADMLSGIGHDERARQQSADWEELSALSPIADLDGHREPVPAADGAPPSRAAYMAAYGAALALIMSASLQRTR